MNLEQCRDLAIEIITHDREDAESVRQLWKCVFFLWIEYREEKIQHAKSEMLYNNYRASEEVRLQIETTQGKAYSIAKNNAENKHWEYRIKKANADGIKSLSDGIKEYINWVKAKWKMENIHIDYNG